MGTFEATVAADSAPLAAESARSFTFIIPDPTPQAAVPTTTSTTSPTTATPKYKRYWNFLGVSSNVSAVPTPAWKTFFRPLGSFDFCGMFVFFFVSLYLKNS